MTIFVEPSVCGDVPSVVGSWDPVLASRFESWTGNQCFCAPL